MIFVFVLCVLVFGCFGHGGFRPTVVSMGTGSGWVGAAQHTHGKGPAFKAGKVEMGNGVMTGEASAVNETDKRKQRAKRFHVDTAQSSGATRKAKKKQKVLIPGVHDMPAVSSGRSSPNQTKGAIVGTCMAWCSNEEVRT